MHDNLHLHLRLTVTLPWLRMRVFKCISCLLRLLHYWTSACDIMYMSDDMVFVVMPSCCV